MLSYSKAEFELRSDAIVDQIVQGSIFIHPTDTIYGIGCDATSTEAVHKLREIKSRYTRPFSIMVPDKTWIRQNCEVNDQVIEWIKKLPGPYTLILKLKNKDAIAPEVNNGLDTIGIRLTDHWIQKGVELLGRPVVTTSANRVGNDFMTSIENLDPEIKSKTDFIIYEGEKLGRPSTIVDLTKDPEDIQKR
ncbi:threonylcarbamoyl-AMP synthase [Candidatus Woesearchaeota archaeon]|nr:threonylcarbamoyl-AMP synthase [Candidatus Woesearchaeota archaeon]